MVDRDKGLLTPEQAYLSMFRFIELYWARCGKPEAITLLLGDVAPVPNKQTADPASWSDFERSIRDVLGKTTTWPNSATED